MDNFLCAVTDFWHGKSPTYFVSKPENQWGEVVKGETYGLTLRLYRTLSGSDASNAAGIPAYLGSSGDLADREEFENYNRASAFGPPVAVQVAYGAQYAADFQQWVPPYFYGYADVQILFTPEWSGQPKLADVRSTATFNYRKQRAFDTFDLSGHEADQGTVSTAGRSNQLDASFKPAGTYVDC